MSLGPAELQELSKAKASAVISGEVVEEDDEEFEMDISEELLVELKSTRDVLRKCLIMVYFFNENVERVTKRERSYLTKLTERIENRLEEADEVIEKCEEE